jgi:hypothetical protein
MMDMMSDLYREPLINTPPQPTDKEFVEWLNRYLDDRKVMAEYRKLRRPPSQK